MVHTLLIASLIFKSVNLVEGIFFPVCVGQQGHGGTRRLKTQMYDSWDKAQINDPFSEVLQMKNHSKEEDNKDIKASREYQSFENESKYC